eukprot:8740448-Pyramimonas_sp.AAC.1
MAIIGPRRRSWGDDCMPPSADEEASKKKEERLLVDLKGLHSSARWCVGSLMAPSPGLLTLACGEKTALWHLHRLTYPRMW